MKDLPVTAQAIQDYILANATDAFVPAKWLLGFCTAVDREIFSKEPPGFPNHLFHPSNKVIGQENQFYGAQHVPAYVARRSFVFHHKEGTLDSSVGHARENITMCHVKKLAGRKRALASVSTLRGWADRVPDAEFWNFWL